jgi:hypothetical protein
MKHPGIFSFCLLILATACHHASAQFLDYGNDPMRYKWNTVRLPHYRLIYPNGLDSLAYRYATWLEGAYRSVGNTMTVSGRLPLFPVVLHPGNMQANGVVSWAPKRMELLTTPARNQHAEIWERHLVMHESRHVFQTSKLRSGLFRPFYYIIGEQAAGLAAAFVPRWFFEGDAVAAETGLSDAGRGRLPEFQMIYRTRKLSGNFFSFDKWHLGSYRDNTGTFYTLGYNLVAYGRYRYGSEIWEKTVDRYTRRPVSFPTFSNAFRHYAVGGLDDLFRQTFDFMGKEWEKLDTGYVIPQFLSPEKKQYTSYQYPQLLNDSTIISLKTSLTDINSIVSITNGRESLLSNIGLINSRLLLHRGKIYWTEYRASMRWSQEVFSLLQCLDPLNGKISTVAQEMKRISDFAFMDSMIALSVISEDGKSRVVIVDPRTGVRSIGDSRLPSGMSVQEITLEGSPVYLSFDAPDGGYIKEVAAGATLVYASVIKEKGIAIYSLDPSSGFWKKILPETRANITGLTFKGNSLLFESGLTGINNIYAMNPADPRPHRITSARFGAFQPTAGIHGRPSLIYVEYQPNGYRIASQPLSENKQEEADFRHPYKFALAERLARQEGVEATAANAVPFRPEKYSKAAHLFSFHSWAPVYYNAREVASGISENFTTAFKPGFSFISQNTLNTAVSQIGYYYSEGTSHGALNMSYSGLPPVLSLSLDYGGKAEDYFWEKAEDESLNFVRHITSRNRISGDIQAYLPFNLTRNSMIRGVRPSISWHFLNDRYQQHKSLRMPYYQYALADILVYNYRRMAAQEILPRWGYQLRMQTLFYPFNPDMFGALYAARLTAYFPGIVRPHSLMMRIGYQYQDVEGKSHYSLSRLLDAPRGNYYESRTMNMLAVKTDYALPLLLPDASIGRLAYIRRVRTNLFYDITFNQEKINAPITHRSGAGIDILMDWNALRFYYSLTTGIRIHHSVESGGTGVEIISSMSF